MHVQAEMHVWQVQHWTFRPNEIDAVGIYPDSRMKIGDYLSLAFFILYIIPSSRFPEQWFNAQTWKENK